MTDPSSKKETPLYGLVLTGGESKRMKQDKSLLDYHGKSQTEYCFQLLSRFCTKVFVSNREDQAGLPSHKDLPQIHDRLGNIGPLDGILSAMTAHPRAAWLVLACDLPYVNEQVLTTLTKKRDRSKIATAYRSTHDGLPEPLCAIYEPESITVLFDSLSEGNTRPQKILINSDVTLIDQDQKTSLDNMNNPEEYRSFKDREDGH